MCSTQPNMLYICLQFWNYYFFPVELYSVLVVSGWHVNTELRTAEILPNHDNCDIPDLPIITTWRPSLIQTHDNNIIMCGGRNNMNKCLLLESRGWSDHSFLTEGRRLATAIVMPNATYFFGGYDTPKTWEWLPTGSSVWQSGGEILGLGHHSGCGASISLTLN